jgi:hypothetical protein
MTIVDYDLPSSEYHQRMALGHSGAHTLLSKCPAIYWHESAHNPDYAREEKSSFDIGNATHLLFLEPDQIETRISHIDADSYRTKDAQIARDLAYAAGKIPLLPQQWQYVQDMRNALLSNDEINRILNFGGTAEASIFWSQYGVERKCRPDFMTDDRRVILDVKTTTDVSIDALRRQIWRTGAYLQPAWYIDGLDAAFEPAERAFYFAAVQSSPPHLVTVFELDDSAYEWGQKMARRACALYRECVESGSWPAYAPGVARLRLPTFAEFALNEMEQLGDLDASEGDDDAI